MFSTIEQLEKMKRAYERKWEQEDKSPAALAARYSAINPRKLDGARTKQVAAADELQEPEDQERPIAAPSCARKLF